MQYSTRQYSAYAKFWGNDNPIQFQIVPFPQQIPCFHLSPDVQYAAYHHTTTCNQLPGWTEASDKRERNGQFPTEGLSHTILARQMLNTTKNLRAEFQSSPWEKQNKDWGRLKPWNQLLPSHIPEFSPSYPKGHWQQIHSDKSIYRRAPVYQWTGRPTPHNQKPEKNCKHHVIGHKHVQCQLQQTHNRPLQGFSCNRALWIWGNADDVQNLKMQTIISNQQSVIWLS